jgi:hypothetical protein
MEKTYYHVTYWQKTPNGTTTTHCWEPVVFVSDRHPFEWMQEWDMRNVKERVISNWQPITKKEYERFRQIVNA